MYCSGYHIRSVTAVICFLFRFCDGDLKSQNLVPNSSFEEYTDFNHTTTGNWQKVQRSDSPDYFNTNRQISEDNMADRYTGIPGPNTGSGFIGIFCYNQNAEKGIRSVREYVEVSLSDSLAKDNLYKVSISIIPDRESNVSVKQIGVLFSPVPLLFKKDGGLFTVTPQVVYELPQEDNISGWLSLQTYYRAMGGEKFIVLGNFRDDRSTILYQRIPLRDKGKKNKWNLTRNDRVAYYYIDDVVVEWEADKVSVIPAEETTFSDMLNINEIAKDSAIILRNIQFDFNSYDLLPQSYAEINKLYHLMKDNPSVKIKLEGHTDNTGSAEYNEVLSLKRVESVALYLISKGIGPDRIEVIGYGYSNPVASNLTEEGRALNRRVAFKIIEK